ncbi:MAG: hypothetical protein AAF961_16185, partial [Planctomycetota bacterium]
VVRKLVADVDRTPVARALAIPKLGKPWSASEGSLMRSVAASGPPALRGAAIRALEDEPGRDAVETLLAIAAQVDDDDQLRADALLALTWHRLHDPTPLFD